MENECRRFAFIYCAFGFDVMSRAKFIFKRPASCGVEMRVPTVDGFYQNAKEEKFVQDFEAMVSEKIALEKEGREIKARVKKIHAQIRKLLGKLGQRAGQVKLIKKRAYAKQKKWIQMEDARLAHVLEQMPGVQRVDPELAT